ncbi:MAG: PEP/pyruvate-binding domain-containing protein [Candidatus Melainabacteria bacterium]|nr:PEP/pyruvate-binding domain-containing protein [Candidatus Melainabacteria bacterium]
MPPASVEPWLLDGARGAWVSPWLPTQTEALSTDWASLVQASPLAQALCSLVGGKALGLLRLQALDLCVPPFWVLSTALLQSVEVPCAQSSEQPPEKIPETLPEPVERCLDVVWQALVAPVSAGPVSLAVRSSAVGEDGVSASFAGQLTTVLHVKTRDQLSAAVWQCWQSLHTESFKVYLAQQQTRQQPLAQASALDAAMAVVIQTMVLPEVSGVVFTANPVSNRLDEAVVTAVWGLGEGLVSGLLDADTFTVSAGGDVLHRHIANKAEAIQVAEHGGTQRVPVPTVLQFAPCLTESTLLRLVMDCRRSAAVFGLPLDVEFAVTGDTLYYLQARPITTLGPEELQPLGAQGQASESAKPVLPNAARVPLVADADWGNRQVWDNANINESYPGITLPLTFSFIQSAYYAVYWQFLELLGLSQQAIRRHEPMLSNMLGLIQGRVYYHLLNWYQLVSLLPGFSFNKGFMEAMMGLTQPEALEAPKPLSVWQRYGVVLPQLFRTGCRAVWLQLTLGWRVQRFHRQFQQVYQSLAAQNIAAMRPHELLAVYEQMEREVLWRWKAPIVNDFSAMIFYGLLKRLTVAWEIDPAGSLQNALLAAQGDLESTRVVSELMAIALSIAQTPERFPGFEALPWQDGLAQLQAEPNVWPKVLAYLDAYGDRCPEELKLESIPVRENLQRLVQTLQQYVGLPHSLQQTASVSESLRLQAEAQLAQAFSRKNRWASIGQSWVYRGVLQQARHAVRNRENQRLERTRAFALVRRLFVRMGKWLQEHGQLEHPRDVFYLEVEELRRFVRGTATAGSLAERVRMRKAEYEQFFQQAPLPHHFETVGPVGLWQVSCRNDMSEPSNSGLEGDSASTILLKGLAACPGRVEAPVVVLLQPDVSLSLVGKILVAQQTDPSWVVLFPGLAGLVVERGSMLSHSAIVAREMGIPAVVGVPNATTLLVTGDEIRLDGSRGTVERLEHPVSANSVWPGSANG